MRIVYLSWPAKEISGGIKLAYRSVECLREHGVEAVIATSDGASPTWFSTSAPTMQLDSVEQRTDILVFPENSAELLRRFAAWKNHKVVFCQNQFMAFRGLGGSRCYSELGATEILAMGRNVVEYCERRFPNLRTVSLPAFVDTEMFRIASHKQLAIAFSPRKRPIEAEFIRDFFRAQYPQWSEIPWIPLVGRTEKEMAKLLSESTVYLSLCRFEAYPLSILEAFASGCIAAGFTGFGGRNYTTSNNGFWADEDDCLDCTEQLASAVRLVVGQTGAYGDMVSQALADAKRHSRARFSEKLLSFWRGRI